MWSVKPRLLRLSEPEVKVGRQHTSRSDSISLSQLGFPVYQVCHIVQTHHLNDDDDDNCTANYGPCFNENLYKHSNLQDS